ncbi:MAG: PIG-L family deacetylase [Candidatus Hydrogenedentes bacterium]|nr:PIG-L family deacetylase [Candidatus Hydrogenedentota bacterium]
MLSFVPKVPGDRPLRILCLGAHSDDIEIGCGATVLYLIAHYKPVEVNWVVFSGGEDRRREALASARSFRRGAAGGRVDLHRFRDGFFPAESPRIKEAFEALKGEVDPDLILTHCREDLHQDHRVVSELTRNTWRSHLILEYEIPKYDGDLGHPNCFVPVTRAQGDRKIAILLKSFPSQRSRQWFDAETFWALMRLRGLECNSPTRYAEAFHVRKQLLS